MLSQNTIISNMISLFKTTSYQKGAALAVGATALWKFISFASSILIAIYFGASSRTDVYFYLIMLMGFGVTFLQRINTTVLIPEAMFLAEQDLSESRRFLTFGFYIYLLIALPMTIPCFKNLGIWPDIVVVFFTSRSVLCVCTRLGCISYYWCFVFVIFPINPIS